MKPISLEMYGFMTYKNKTFIDFTKLYDSKIFLISGDTGSGKTSIFDAISFALFGEIQREGFVNNDIRSDFLSGEDNKTYVDLKFEVDGNIYRIIRVPKQIAKKTRANVNVGHSVELYKYENNEEILLSDGVKETEKLINEIIGLNNDQLNRVMILAQGEFSKFLKSSSDDKAELLSKIFRTYIYKDIEDLLKEKSRDSKKNLDNISKNLKVEIRKNEYLDQTISDNQIELKDFKTIFESIDRKIKNLSENLSESEKKKNDISIELENKNKEYSLYSNQNSQIQMLNSLNQEKNKLLIKKDDYDIKKERLSLSEKAESLRPYYINLCERKSNIKSYKEKIEQNRKELEKIEEKKASLNKKDKKIKNLKSNLEIRKENLIGINNILKEFEALKEIESEINKFKKDFERSKEIKKLLEKKENDINSIIKKISEKSEELLKINTNLQDINDKGHKESTLKLENENLLNQAIENDKKLEDYKTSMENIEKLKIELKESQSLLEKAKNQRRNKELNFFKKEVNESGICPVCGSIHNEMIEIIPIDDLDFDKVNEKYISIKNKIEYEENREFSINENLKDSKFYKNKQKDLENNVDDLRNLYKKVKKEETSISEEKNTLSKNLNDEKRKFKEFEEELEKFQGFNDIEKLQQKYEIKKEELDKFSYDDLYDKSEKEKTSIKNDEVKIKDYEDTLVKLEKNLQSLTSLDKSYENFLRENENKLSDEKEYFKKRLSDKFSNLDEFLFTLEKSQDYLSQKEDIEEFFEILNTVDIKISSLSQYKDKSIVNLDEFKEKIDNIKLKLRKIEDEIFNQKLQKSKLVSTKDEVLNIKSKLSELHKEDEILYKLSRICDGSISKVKGVEKLNLETFVLTNYFKKILYYANIRLKDMTDGQFMMKRKTESTDKRRNFGLDIEILDANTGKIRSEASLSGGESFIASLSLALGLSDEISQENGGIKIDTLFIDEGFGTLSDDYLDKTIRTIEKLSYNNKFIGLISHVKELKDAIDAKIEVKYSKTDGSSLEVIVWLI